MIEKNDLWLTSFQAKNNKILQVRYVLPGDEVHFIDIFEHMGEESRYQRFNQSQSNLSINKIRTEAQRMVEVTVENGLGLIAFGEVAGETAVPIAAARYIKMNEKTAEVAMSVRDDMHGQGIGTILFNLLLEEAKKNGLTKLVGMMQNSNTAMWIVFDRLPYPVTRIPDGTVSDIEIDLTRFKETG